MLVEMVQYFPLLLGAFFHFLHQMTEPPHPREEVGMQLSLEPTVGDETHRVHARVEGRLVLRYPIHSWMGWVMGSRIPPQQESPEAAAEETGAAAE